MIFSSCYGNIFKSSDNGKSWISFNRGFKHKYNFSALAGNDKDIFAGTSGGIFKSNKKENEWEVMEPLKENAEQPSYAYTYETLLINGSDIFAGTEKGVYKSSDAGDTWIEFNNGLPRKHKGYIKISSLLKYGNIYPCRWRFSIFVYSSSSKINFSRELPEDT